MGIIAFDLGASSGRALLGRLTDRHIVTEEIHRFPNDPVQIGNHLYWDILRLYHEIKQGLLKAKLSGESPSSLGVDSWAVDFGFIGADGSLLGNPSHYRDRQTEGMMEEVFQKIPSDELFGRTGIQFLPFNSIFQLYAMRRADLSILRIANRFLMVPDLIRYFLTGEMLNEFTNATTTQLYNPSTGGWDNELLDRLGFPRFWFGPPVSPGSEAGVLAPSVSMELDVETIRVVAVAEHDTASAVVAIPALKRPFAYLISGTWSLLGTEVNRPVIDELTRKWNFTNEGGAYGTYRLLKNIMGLWLLQECRREWERKGKSYSFQELVALAQRAKPFAAFIDPDDPVFLPPGDMPARIRAYCARTGQEPPEGAGEMTRCILESLALKYRYILRLTEVVSNQRFDGLHMVGGGIHNRLLCQWTANAIGRVVWAGPAEGSAIGNLAVQWIAAGEFRDLFEARSIIRESFPFEGYEPQQVSKWEEAYMRFLRITGLANMEG